MFPHCKLIEKICQDEKEREHRNLPDALFGVRYRSEAIKLLQ